MAGELDRYRAGLQWSVRLDVAVLVQRYETSTAIRMELRWLFNIPVTGT